MARTGRPCLPNALREMKGGHYRKHNAAEPRPSGAVRCPSQLRPEVRRVWRRLAKVLMPLGLLSAADQDNFALLCVAVERWGRAQQQISQFGEVVAVKGKPQPNPWLRIASEAEQVISRVGGEFGLSPSSRTRLFSSVLAPIPAPGTLNNNQDIAESFFTESSTGGDDTSVN